MRLVLVGNQFIIQFAMYLALGLIFATAAYRIIGAHSPELFNFSPMMALALCGAIYLRGSVSYLAPLGALLISDLILNRHYGVEWISGAMLVSYSCYALAFGAGRWIAPRKSWALLFGGAIAGSAIFYLATNTFSWLGDPYYLKGWAGWAKALTIGHPEFTPTWMFFRHSVASNLLFVAMMALIMEWAAYKEGAHSLFGQNRKLTHAL